MVRKLRLYCQRYLRRRRWRQHERVNIQNYYGVEIVYYLTTLAYNQFSNPFSRGVMIYLYWSSNGSSYIVVPGDKIVHRYIVRVVAQVVVEQKVMVSAWYIVRGMHVVLPLSVQICTSTTCRTQMSESCLCPFSGLYIPCLYIYLMPGGPLYLNIFSRFLYILVSVDPYFFYPFLTSR